jgi:8-oxo-dGTP pyrophosphatase MutT (NUDIX family)
MRFYTQHAALPYIRIGDQIEICLLTSKGRGRWVIPKGWPKRGLSARALAAREAFEEAGLVGEVETTALGTYTYRKRLHFFATLLCKVDVYPFRVDSQMLDWPECDLRRRAWFSPEEAADLVDEPELAEILLQIGKRDFDQSPQTY